MLSKCLIHKGSKVRLVSGYYAMMPEGVGKGMKKRTYLMFCPKCNSNYYKKVLV